MQQTAPELVGPRPPRPVAACDRRRARSRPARPGRAVPRLGRAHRREPPACAASPRCGSGGAISLEREVETRPDRLASGRADRRGREGPVAGARQRRPARRPWLGRPQGHGRTPRPARARRRRHPLRRARRPQHPPRRPRPHRSGCLVARSDPGIRLADRRRHDGQLGAARHRDARGRARHPAVRGVDWVTAGEPVTAAELDAALAAAGGVTSSRRRPGHLPGPGPLRGRGQRLPERCGGGHASGHRRRMARSGSPRRSPALVLWDFHDARNNAGARSRCTT